MANPVLANPQQETREMIGSEPVTSDEVYANVIQEERVRNMLYQSSPDNQLIDLQWRLRGYVKNQFTQQWEKVDSSSIEPDTKLISNFISYVASLVHDGTRWTCLADSEINAVMNQSIEWVTDELSTNAEEYGQVISSQKGQRWDTFC